MAVGSSYAALKRAITTQLKARSALSAVSVSYQAPLQAKDVLDASGSGTAIWLEDSEGAHENVVICSLPLQLEERYALGLIIQVVFDSSDGTQEAADERCDELLYEVLAELANDPTFGLSTGDPYNYLHVTRSTWRRGGGFLPSGAGHGAWIRLLLDVEARIHFTEE